MKTTGEIKGTHETYTLSMATSSNVLSREAHVPPSHGSHVCKFPCQICGIICETHAHSHVKPGEQLSGFRGRGPRSGVI